MAGRSILITGCSSGIGLVAARMLKARGWRVFATARTEADLAALAEEGLVALRLDYADPASIADVADRVLAETGGKLFALFNNGAYGQPGAVEDLTPAVLRAEFEANFFGWHDLTVRLLPAMRRAGRGRIIQCSSVLGLVAMRYRGAYVATKFALEGLTDAMRLELAGSGIHVSTIQPGPIATKFVENSVRAFEKNIDAENSPHSEAYAARMSKLKAGGARTMKLPPEAVVARLIDALESPKPRPHYYVTSATYLMAAARRLLPVRLLDHLVMKVDG